jgi:hypothetical protein
VAQRPERAPLQGAKVTSRISGESEPLMSSATESLIVKHVPVQQRRSFREAVCEEWAGAAAGAGATRQARCVFLPTGYNVKQRGDVKRAGASARTSEHDRASAYQPISGRTPPASNCSKTGLRRQTVEIPVFEISLGKTGLHKRVPVTFPDPGWGKIGGKNRRDLKAFGGVYTRSNSTVFWQTERLLRLIFHRKRKKRVYRLFRYWPGHSRGKRSPCRAYFT